MSKKYKHNKKKARVIQNFDLKNDLEEVLRMSSQDDLMTSSKINLRKSSQDSVKPKL